VVELFRGDVGLEGGVVDVSAADDEDDVAGACEVDGVIEESGSGDGTGRFDAESVSFVPPAHCFLSERVGNHGDGGDESMQDGPVVEADIVGEKAVTNPMREFVALSGA